MKAESGGSAVAPGAASPAAATPTAAPPTPHDRCALVILTRVPAPGQTKTRMMPDLSPDQCAAFHEALLEDAARLARALADAVDVFVAYAPPGAAAPVQAAFGGDVYYFEQEGDGFGARMRDAARVVADAGYARCALMGTDAPEVRPTDVLRAFALLDEADVAIGPADDGGYYLIAFRGVPADLFNLPTYGHDAVLEQTLDAARAAGCTCVLLRTVSDIDTWADAAALLGRAADEELGRLASVRYLRSLGRKGA